MYEGSMMEHFGFYRVGASVPVVTVAHCKKNADMIIAAVHQAETTDILLFPQLSITAATCGSLFLQQQLLDDAVQAVLAIAEQTAKSSAAVVVGLPMAYNNAVYNCSAVLAGGKVCGIVPLDPPAHTVFSQYTNQELADAGAIFGTSYPIPFARTILFEYDKHPASFSITHRNVRPHPLLVLEPLAQPSSPDLEDRLHQQYAARSAEYACACMCANAGLGESSTDSVFGGECAVFENGALRAAHSAHAQFLHTNEHPLAAKTAPLLMYDIDTELLRHEQRLRQHTIPRTDTAQARTTRVVLPPLHRKNTPLLRSVSAQPFVSETCTTAHELARQTKKKVQDMAFFHASALAKRLIHTGITNMLLGFSGGLDSTLALIIACQAREFLHLPDTAVTALVMPGFGSTSRTQQNAQSLAALLQCRTETIPINAAVIQHFTDIHQSPDCHDRTYENAQARERTQILMDKANQIGGLVIGTGDLSESALGWCTYNGDHISMYNVNAAVPKSLVRETVRYYIDHPPNSIGKSNTAAWKQILTDIVDTPISPELLPNKEGTNPQLTEKLLGPYNVFDFFLYYTIRYGFTPKKILFLAEAAFNTPSEKNDPPIPRNELIKLLKTFYTRFFSQQFKRSCSADGAGSSGISLSPRAGLHHPWIMPSDADAALWLNELGQALEQEHAD